MQESSYWDLSEFQRSELSEDAVQSYLKRHLMERGVLNPAPLNLSEEPEVVVATTEAYKVQIGWSADLVFKDRESATSLLELGVQGLNRIGDYVKMAPMENLKVEPIDVMCDPDAEGLGEKLSRLKEAREHNKKERERYDKETMAVSECCSEVWADWNQQKRKRSQFDNMYSHLNEYVQMCDGDQEKAIAFLRKAKGDVVDEALDWHPDWQGESRLKKVADSASQPETRSPDSASQPETERPF